MRLHEFLLQLFSSVLASNTTYDYRLGTFNSWLYLFTANANCDATCGKSFNGMQVEIMDPDFVSGDGEIVIHSRNVFMGYAKVCDYHNYQNLLLSNFILYSTFNSYL